MEDDHQQNHGGEIIVRITARNLERLIYMLVILGLVITTIVAFNKEGSDCSETCEANIQEGSEVSLEPAASGGSASSTPTNTISGAATTTVATTTTPATTTTNADLALSGKVDFLLTEVKLCEDPDQDDKGRFESVTLFIKNGYSRTLEAKVQLYLWSGSTFDPIESIGPKIKDLQIMSGNTLSREITVDSGLFDSKGWFIDVDEDQKVKAVLIDDELNIEIGSQIKSGIKVTSDCD